MTRAFDLYVDLAAAARRRPRTAAKLHAALGEPIGLTPMRRILRRLMDAGVLRAAGWTAGKNAERIYGIANGGPNVSHPGRVDPAVRQTELVGRFGAIWRELEGPTSAAELRESCGTSICTGRKLMQRMAEHGLVGVRYRVDGAQRTAIYQRDAQSLPPLPPQSRDEKYRRFKAQREGRALHQLFTFSSALPPPARLLR